jgi:hypothetical protein
MRSHLAAIATLLALSLAPPLARAGSPPIVLESYVSERPADAAKILGPFLNELAAKKFVFGADRVGRPFEASTSKPAGAGLRRDFAEAVALGYELWTNGRFDDASDKLGELVEEARQNPGAFAKEQALSQHLQRALIALSLSQLKLGDRPTARKTMEEALRGNPTLRITRGMYGQDAADLFNEITREAADSMGRLIVTVDEGSGIFVNERLAGMNSIQEDLPPGEYRIVALFGKEPSRVYKVALKRRDIHELAIERSLDRAVYTGPDWAGFQYAAVGDREREAAHGARFATAIDAEQVVVVGIEIVRGRRSISAALINKESGREIRRAIVPAGAPAEQLRNLARFLAGEPATPDIMPVPPRELQGEHTAPVGVAPKRLWSGWKYLTGGAAIAAGIAGGVVLSYNGKCSTDVEPGVPCPNSYNGAAGGWLLIGGAVALAGVTVYLVMTERRGAPSRTAYLVPTAGGALAGYAARF